MKLFYVVLMLSTACFASFNLEIGERETFIKVSKNNSTQLDESQKCTLYSMNRYQLNKRAKLEGNHYYVELTEEIPGCDFTEGYVFTGHSTVEPETAPLTTGVKCRSYSTGYYPHNSKLEGGYLDRFGAKLRTLQDYLEGKVEYVTVAMDKPYSRGLARSGGRRVRIPELERTYNNGNYIDFRVLDTGSAFYNKGAKKIDICMRGYRQTLDSRINKPLDIYFVDGDITCDE